LVRRAGFGWSGRPEQEFRRRDRERAVAGALIQEELAWLRDGSFDLDLIGFDATELERLLALAHGEAGSDDAEDEVPGTARRSGHPAGRPLDPAQDAIVAALLEEGSQLLQIGVVGHLNPRWSRF
jgi:hypothetical protein